MKFASSLGFVALLTTCGAGQPRALTLATFALQCEPTRSVVCAVSNDLTVAQCNAVVPEAVDAINKAVGRELLRYDGIITSAGSEHAYESGAIVVAGQPNLGASLGRPELQVFGFTPSEKEVRDGTVCLTRTFMWLDPRLFGEWHEYLHSTVLHEMLHAIGIAHSPNFSPPSFKSVMSPTADSPNHSDTLTPADILSLRTIYG